MRHRSYSHEAYIIIRVKKFKVVFLCGGEEVVKIENMKEESALGMKVRDDLPEITGRERASCAKKGKKTFWGNSMCKDPEAENWWFEELNESNVLRN